MCIITWAGDLDRSLEDLEAMSCAATSGSGRGIGRGMFGLIRCYITFLKALGHGSRLQAEVLPLKPDISLFHVSLCYVTDAHLFSLANRLANDQKCSRPDWSRIHYAY